MRTDVDFPDLSVLYFAVQPQRCFSSIVSFMKYRRREIVKVIFSRLILPHQYFMDLIDFRVTVIWEIILSSRFSGGF